MTSVVAYTGDVEVIADDTVTTIVVNEQGPPGLRGNSVLSGTSNPITPQGIDGDFYLNTATMVMWGPKFGGVWPGTGVPITGPPGPQGNPGPLGPQGVPGPPGTSILNGLGPPPAYIGNDGDFYIDTLTAIMYGPKASGAWPGTGLSMIGPPAWAAPTTWATATAYTATPPPAQCVLNAGSSYVCTVSHTSGTFATDLAAGKWALIAQGSAGGISDAPTDSNTYARRNSLWVTCLNLTGGTLTGPLVLAADPTTSLQAATKNYVDTHAAGLTDAPSDGTLYGRRNLTWTRGVQLAGDTMTGLLNLSADPTAALGAATKQYIDNRAVRYDTPQSLTAAQAQQGRQNIIASPFSGMMPHNIVINGCCEINLFGVTTKSGITGGSVAYLSDQFYVSANGAATVLGSISGTPPPGFLQCNEVQNTSTHASPAAGDLMYIAQPIEGIRWTRLGWGSAGALPVTLSFWANSNRTGTYAVALNNAQAPASYVIDFTITTANVWQFFQFTIPPDTATAWSATATLRQAVLSWAVMGGSNYRAATPSVWNTSNLYVTVNTSTTFANTANNGLYITGVSLVPGNEGPSQDRSPLFVRSATEEMLLCQRYALPISGGGYYNITTQPQTLGTVANFPTVMRAVPTIGYTSMNGSSGFGTSVGGTYTTADQTLIYNSANATGAVAYSARVAVNARM